ncbi:protein serine/threonine phosphatase 2C [Neoconidiobolus thromboides FSU 785]|nr:protein serine/threonine phosphatase 2C [Neoconidiobolus thromboides FSU 785]
MLQSEPQTNHYTPNYSLYSACSGQAKKKQKVESDDGDKALYSKGYGEDSVFCRSDALGIADGVGGWSLNNGNSAFYSRKLMHYVYSELNKYDDIDADEFVDYFHADPVNILAKSYDRTNFDAYLQQIKGSTTACLALLRGDELRIANLGDCGLAIIRDGDFLFRTEEQQHSFNYPYQLGIVGGDHPLSAQRFKVQVKKGDIIVLGSDGLYDNLFDDDILDIVQKSIDRQDAGFGQIREEINPQIIANNLKIAARDVAENTRNMSSPFQERATLEGMYYQGGKLDDISVIVGVVWDAEDSPDRR